MSEMAELRRDPGAPPPPAAWLAARPAVAVGAAACLLALAAGSIGVALGSRSGTPAFSSTIVPAAPAPAQGTGGDTAAATRAAAPAAAAGASSASAAAVAPGPGISLPVPTTCSAAPTVQFQGRGLVVTGVAPVTSAGTAPSLLNVSVQERGADPSTVVTSAQSKVQAVISGLQQAGVPASKIQQVSFSSYGDAMNRSFTAWATVQATIAGPDQLAQASRAILQVSGITGYSTSSGLSAQPTAEEVQSGVEAAAQQARDMAMGTARAAGVTLGAVQSVAAPPPTICYGSGGPTRVVQVTMTYALK